MSRYGGLDDVISDATISAGNRTAGRAAGDASGAAADALGGAAKKGVLDKLGTGAANTLKLALGGTALAGGAGYGYYAAVTGEEGNTWHTILDAVTPGDLPVGLSHEQAIESIKSLPSNTVENINEAFGTGQARAGATIGKETFFASLEAIGDVLNQFFGGADGNGFLSWINTGREGMGLEPKVAVPGGKPILQSDFDSQALTENMDNNTLVNAFASEHIASGRSMTADDFVTSVGNVHGQLGNVIENMSSPARDEFNANLLEAVNDPSLTTDTAKLTKAGEMIAKVEDSIIASGSANEANVNAAVLKM